MPQRPSPDWPRLSGRPGAPRQTSTPNQTVFRRFFELIEKLEKPRGAPANKAHGPAGSSGAPRKPGK